MAVDNKTKSPTRLRSFLLFGVVLGGIYWSYSQGSLGSFVNSLGKNSEPKFALADYKLETASLREMRQTVLATGTVTLEIGAEVRIGSRISGQLEKLFVQIGDFIQAGEVIAVVEHSNLKARILQRRAELHAEKARLAKIRNEGPLDINKSRAELEEFRVQEKLAKKMLIRNQELSEKGIISVTKLDESEQDLEVLEARIKSASEFLKLKETQLVHNIDLAEANVAKAEANLLEEETQLSYATIVAPTDGIVASISTQKGETVAANFNSPTFINLIDLRKLEVTVFVDETDIGRVRINQEAIFTVDSFPKIFFKGIVRDIHPKAIIKDNVVNYETILKIGKESFDLLRPEMTANVVITTQKKKGLLAVPKKAVRRKGKKEFIIIKDGNLLIERVLTTGWRDGKYVEVLSGMKEGDFFGIPISRSELKKNRRRRS